VSDESSTEIEVVGADAELMAVEAALGAELAAEQSVWRSVIMGTVIATPICVAVWIAIVVFAVGPEGPDDWLAWLGIGAGVGVLAGAFFGGWAGFTMKAHLLDELDASSARH
jgi:hypothetical protein